MLQQDEAHVERWHREFAHAAADQPPLIAFGPVWPLSYLAVASPDRAIADARALLQLQPRTPHVAFSEGADGWPRCTIAMIERPLSLGEILPALQSLGLEVHSEQPFRLTRPDGVTCWLYDLVLENSATATDPDTRSRLAEAFSALWAGQAETDQFNRLVTVAGLTWREAAVMRTYGQYLHQLRVPWGRTYTASVLADHPKVTRQLRDLFTARFDRPPTTSSNGSRSCTTPSRQPSTTSTTSPQTRFSAATSTL